LLQKKLTERLKPRQGCDCSKS